MDTVLVKWHRPKPEKRPRRRWALAALALIAGCAATLRQSDDSFAPKLAAECEEPASCRALVSEAERRVETCDLSCAGEQRDLARTRSLLRKALERDAQNKFAASKERRRHEQLRRERETQRLADEKRHEDLRAANKEHQRKLELIAAEGEERRKSEVAQRRQQISYLERLTPEQRTDRLVQCHRSGRDCDSVAELLVSSAPRAAEKRALIELTEQLRGAGTNAACSPSPATTVPARIAAPRRERPTSLSQRAERKRPTQCCDGSIAIGCTCSDDPGRCCATNGGACGCAG